ncbi:hypothetical protein NDU88_006899 [Pleurodeles waltl]|uniref:Uncharacterized protein n=1 Tax=Pleurodeles waltl TaxID=8319 RepID=A0AAV7RTC5_PLEWA|nr:hypothetical protein NDU88_006899 [Pleurodeles waltl]
MLPRFLPEPLLLCPPSGRLRSLLCALTGSRSRAKEEHGQAAPSLGCSPSAAAPRADPRHSDQSSVSHLTAVAGASEVETQRKSVQPRLRRHSRPGRTASGTHGTSQAHLREGPIPTPIRRGKVQLGVRRGRARRPEASGSRLPLPERWEALQVQTHATDPTQGQGGREPPDSARVIFLFFPCSPACSGGPNRSFALCKGLQGSG